MKISRWSGLWIVGNLALAAVLALSIIYGSSWLLEKGTRHGESFEVPDFEGKSFEASLRVLNHYERFPYFRAKKLENVAFHKVREVFLDGNLQLNERTRDFDYVLELEREREKIEMGEDYNDNE